MGTADNIEAAALMIMSGGYLGYLPEHYAAHLESKGVLRAINRPLFNFDVEFHLVSRKSPTERDVVRAFREDLLLQYQHADIALAMHSYV